MRHAILFVCTGNTCRSPVAEALLKQMVDTLGMKAGRPKNMRSVE